MKLLIFGCSLIFINSCKASQWQDFKSPMELPQNKELVDSFLRDISPRDIPIEGRIVGGSPAQLGQFPYQVYLYLLPRNGPSMLCGGSVIDKRWILTAGHCVVDVVQVMVHFGAINQFGDGRSGAFVKQINVTNSKDIIMHKAYNSRTYANDIALIKLPEDAPIGNSNVGLVALPNGTEFSRNLTGLQATIAGFGKFNDNIDESSPTLLYVTLPIADNSLCNGTFEAGMVTNNSLCLQSIGLRSACNGDSGGGLTVVGTNGQVVQVGIVSYGAAAGCQRGFPQVFTRVTSYLSWIDEQTSGASGLSRFAFLSVSLLMVIHFTF